VPVSAQSVEQGLIGELQQMLRQQNEMVRQQNAVILELRRRVEQLEQAQGIQPEPAAQQSAEAPLPEPKPVDPVPATPAPAPPSSTVAETRDDPDEATRAPADAAPGEFEVDPDAIDRALERTLVESGVLLLPFGVAEVVPRFSYTRRERDTPIGVGRVGGVVVGERDIRRDEFEPSLGLRMGMPYDAQIEVNLPFNIVREERRTRVNFGIETAEDQTGIGLDDLSIGLAKTLFMEEGYRPDLVARLFWNTATGVTQDNGVALGSDFQSLRASLSAVKRQDPLAFTGDLSYETTFERNGIEPGDEFGFSIGTVLAASPATSLRLGVSQSFLMERSVEGNDIEGSDQVEAALTVGAASVIWRGVLLDVSGAVGLTDDSPDYAVRIALPVRFTLPWAP
jgi:hypothetical protein